MKARLPQGYGGGGAATCSSWPARPRKCRSKWKLSPTSWKEKEYSATSGGDAVKATVTGKMEVKSVEIKPEVIDPEDAEMLGDLVTAAVNEALRAASQEKEERMSALSGGMNIPGLF